MRELYFNVHHKTVYKGGFVDDRFIPEYTHAICINLRSRVTREVIGYIDLIKTKHKFYETHSFLDEDRRGQGLGKSLYEKAFEFAMEHDLNLRSSRKPSIAAIYVWNSSELNNQYKISKIGDRFVLRGEK